MAGRRLSAIPDSLLQPAVRLPAMSESERQDRIVAEIDALRTARRQNAEPARAWSYLAMEGGKGKNANRNPR
jgi:hypothetical protein